MRKPTSKAKASLRSINLAISARGISALNSIAPHAAERFLSDAIPMKGRMIHGQNGEQQSQLYDRNGQVSNLDIKLTKLPSLRHSHPKAEEPIQLLLITFPSSV